jgi:P pilus assembly chaperone PapD
MKSSRFLLALALAAAPFIASATPTSTTIAVNKAELITDLVPNEKRVLQLSVTNSGTVAVPITVYSEDWQIAKGVPDYNNQTHARALGKRVSVTPTNFDLAPGTSQEVTVVVDAGPGPFVDGSYWSAIFVQNSHLTATPVDDKSHGAQMRIVQRIAVLLFADSNPETGPLPADVAITDIKRSLGGVDVSVSNPSAYMRMVSGALVTLTPLAKGETIKMPLHSFRLLPGCSQDVAAIIPSSFTGIGRASVMAVIDYGARDLVSGEARLVF